MKQLTMFALLFSTALLVASCQEQDSIDLKREKMYEIAVSDLFAEYMDTLYQSALYVNIKAFDGAAIDKLLDKYPELSDACDFDRNLYENIRGGALWFECHCKLEQLTEALDANYDYLKYSVDDRLTMQEMYKLATDMAGEEALKEKVFNHLLKNEK